MIDKKLRQETKIALRKIGVGAPASLIRAEVREHLDRIPNDKLLAAMRTAVADESNKSIRASLLDEALSAIEQAKSAMGRLAVLSDDWAARASLFAEFESVDDACREFARHQIGLAVPTADEPTRKKK